LNWPFDNVVEPPNRINIMRTVTFSIFSIFSIFGATAFADPMTMTGGDDLLPGHLTGDELDIVTLEIPEYPFVGCEACEVVVKDEEGKEINGPTTAVYSRGNNDSRELQKQLNATGSTAVYETARMTIGVELDASTCECVDEHCEGEAELTWTITSTPSTTSSYHGYHGSYGMSAINSDDVAVEEPAEDGSYDVKLSPIEFPSGSPFYMDTDGDGVSDRDELNAEPETDPLDGDGDPQWVTTTTDLVPCAETMDGEAHVSTIMVSELSQAGRTYVPSQPSPALLATAEVTMAKIGECINEASIEIFAVEFWWDWAPWVVEAEDELPNVNAEEVSDTGPVTQSGTFSLLRRIDEGAGDAQEEPFPKKAY
jgi:hypothetical protein